MPNLKIPAPLSGYKNSSGGMRNFIFQFLIVAILFFAIGFAAGQKKIELELKNYIPNITFTNQTPSEAQVVDFSLFWEVYRTLPQKYLEKTDIDGQKILHGAISGMVKSLGDPYTTFLDPKQNEAVMSELAGSYEGVGIQIGFNKDNRLVVIAPLRDTPAERMGLKAKDLILQIGDRDTFDITLPQAVELIRGEAGTTVKLVLLPEGEQEPYEVEIERAQINVKSVNLEFRETNGKKIAIIDVSRFGEQTDGEWDSAVDQVLAEGARGVIVDMRNNPGGLLASSVHLSSEFIRGTVVKQQIANGSITSLGVDHSGRLLNIPLSVLVNGGSASAAEIFAGAMKDANRAQIVGEQTFGKGSVQDVVEYTGGSALHVTIAKWLTPDGHSIHEVGITPDVIIEPGESDADQEEQDLQLEKALELVAR